MNNSFARLHDSIRDYARQIESLEVLDEGLVSELAATVAERFVKEPESLWWWESLRGPVAHMEYGESDGLETLTKLLAEKRERLTLMITDDEPPPWIAVRGDLASIVQLLREHQFFEYFIVDESRAWVVFDTHHNFLVSVGPVQ